MNTSTGDFALTMAELRVVADFARASAEEALHIFETAQPDDARPRAAVEAARAFADGGPRGALQRVTSTDAHRAARDVRDEAAAHAARAAGDAAAAAYLHPLAQATQVGHILRATAQAARALELSAGADPQVGEAAIERARQRATATLVEVLCRYPVAPTGRDRVAELMSCLDTALRSEPSPAGAGSAECAVQRDEATGWLRHDGDLGVATGRALRFLRQEFPGAQAAFLGGSVATGHATRHSDLDLLIILPAPWDQVSFVETSRFEGQLVESFVYGRAALPTWLERGRTQHRPVLDRLAAEGIPLINSPLSQELGEHSRAALDAGPDPADPDDLARRAYSVSSHLDDLADRNEAATDTDPAERAVLTWTLWREAAELSLLTQRRWLGTGKWLVRELRACGDPHGLADWAERPEDTQRLATVARTVLDATGGRLQEGFIRGDRPPDL